MSLCHFDYMIGAKKLLSIVMDVESTGSRGDPSILSRNHGRLRCNAYISTESLVRAIGRLASSAYSNLFPYCSPQPRVHLGLSIPDTRVCYHSNVWEAKTWHMLGMQRAHSTPFKYDRKCGYKGRRKNKYRTLGAVTLVVLVPTAPE